MQIEIYTDGACKGNPGPGGWAALLRFAGQEKKIHGSEVQTTNNRMELMAAIQALNILKLTSEVNLYTDSQYVRQGMMGWIKQWKKNGWKNSKKQPVKNIDLWQQLDALAAQHSITWHWVKGHSGHVENDLVDALANAAIESMLAGVP